LGKPKLLLLDEHLASLDAVFVDVADQLVRSARTKQNMAVLAVSHNADWVHSFCDRVVRLVDGQFQDLLLEHKSI
jgi:putative tryptophan/tyrosine transport system ATP-binding protein